MPRKSTRKTASTADGPPVTGPGLGCRPMPPTLNELRAALFFEQRCYRWNETEPAGKDLRFIRALVAAIANAVRDREGGTE